MFDNSLTVTNSETLSILRSVSSSLRTVSFLYFFFEKPDPILAKVFLMLAFNSNSSISGRSGFFLPFFLPLSFLENPLDSGEKRGISSVGTMAVLCPVPPEGV
jgi:hypothetical protein